MIASNAISIPVFLYLEFDSMINEAMGENIDLSQYALIKPFYPYY
jgi:hypothetical protein